MLAAGDNRERSTVLSGDESVRRSGGRVRVLTMKMQPKPGDGDNLAVTQ